MGCDIAGKNRKNGLNQIGQSLEMVKNGTKLFLKSHLILIYFVKSWILESGIFGLIL